MSAVTALGVLAIGWAASHPVPTAVFAGCVLLLAAGGAVAVALTGEKHVACYGSYTPREVADFRAVFAQVEAHDPGPLAIPLGIHLPAVPGAAVNITSAGAGSGRLAPVRVPARTILPGGDGPGPVSMRSPGAADGEVPSPSAPSPAPGPGTSPHEVWEPCLHDPVCAPTGPLWSKQPAIGGGDQ